LSYYLAVHCHVDGTADWSRTIMSDPRKFLALSVVLFLGAAFVFGASLRPALFSTPDPALRSVHATRTDPFQQKLDFTLSANPSFVVPSDKRLGLTYAAAKITTSPGQQPLVLIRTTAGGATGEFSLLMTLQARNIGGTDVFVASQSLAGVFADGGSKVTALAQTAEGRPFNGSVTLAGVLEDR
jgi:hypothetical protein